MESFMVKSFENQPWRMLRYLLLSLLLLAAAGKGCRCGCRHRLEENQRRRLTGGCTHAGRVCRWPFAEYDQYSA